jgi:hypothetical protein
LRQLPPLLLMLSPTPRQPLPLRMHLLPPCCSGLDRKAAALAELAADAGGDLSPRSRQAYQRIHREFDRLIARAREEVETAEALAAVADEVAGECTALQPLLVLLVLQQLLASSASQRSAPCVGGSLQAARVLACTAPLSCSAGPSS